METGLKRNRITKKLFVLHQGAQADYVPPKGGAIEVVTSADTAEYRLQNTERVWSMRTTRATIGRFSLTDITQWIGKETAVQGQEGNCMDYLRHA
jgi:hypothetical protein